MSFFDKPKQDDKPIEADQKRWFHGQDDYKKPCTILEVLNNGKVIITIEGSQHTTLKGNIGRLCD